MNTASVGWFSSDRTIAEYAAEIWHVKAPER
jgi:glucan phosphorylase